MNLASFAQNLKFLENREYAETILTEKQLAKEDDNRTGAADEWDRSNRKQSKKVRVLPLIEFEPELSRKGTKEPTSQAMTRI
jgi:hypothetical protein